MPIKAVGLNVSFSIDKESRDRTYQMLADIKNGSLIALTRALNATASKARTRAVKEIRRDIRMKARDIKDRVDGPAQSYKNKATFNNLQSRITTPARGLRMANFVTSAIPEGRPVKTRVKPRGRAKVWPTAWIMRLKKGKSRGDLYGVFTRDIHSGYVRHRYGPSLSQVLRQELVHGTLHKEMQEELEVQIDAKVEGVIKQYGGK